MISGKIKYCAFAIMAWAVAGGQVWATDQQVRTLPTEDELLLSSLANPFLTEDEQSLAFSGAKPCRLLALSVDAISCSPSGRWAVVDGKVVTEGDKVGEKKVTRINKSEVVLEDDRYQYCIEIRGE